MRYLKFLTKRINSFTFGILIAIVVLVGFALIAWSATLFEDDFTKPVEGWLVGPGPQGKATWGFSDGKYQVLITRPETVTKSLAPTGQDFTNFCLKVGARQLPVSPGEVGLAFGYKDQDKGVVFNTFGVFEDGSYRLGHFSQGELSNLNVSTAPMKLYPSASGRFNNLRVVVQNGTIQFYGNDKLLATVKEQDLKTTGRIGFFGRSGPEPFVTGRFDYITIMTPDCEP